MAPRGNPDEHAPREPWQYTLAAVFTAAAASDVLPIVQWLRGQDSDPGALVLWHGVTFATAIACLLAVWRRHSWAPYAVAAWGVANTTLVLAVPFLVNLPKEALPGIWGGAAVVGVLATVCVLVIRRKLSQQ